jgi:hypothetical protein
VYVDRGWSRKELYEAWVLSLVDTSIPVCLLVSQFPEKQANATTLAQFEVPYPNLELRASCV